MSGEWAIYSIRFKPLHLRSQSLNNHSAEKSYIIIDQNEIVTNSIFIVAELWIKDLIPISHTGHSDEHMQVNVTTEWDPYQNLYSTTYVQMCSNSVGLVVSGALLPPDLQTPWIALQRESGFICDKYRNVFLSGLGNVFSLDQINGLFSVVCGGGHA